MLDLSNFAYILPEIILIAGVLLVVLVGSIFKPRSFYGYFAAAFLLLAFILSLTHKPSETLILLNGLVVVSPYVTLAKTVTLLSTVCVVAISIGYRCNDFVREYEYYVLILFATIGALVMLSSNDLMSLYIGLELLSLPVYALVAFNRKNLWSSEGGLKYFILGILASVILLYGMTIIYGSTGTTNFSVFRSLYTSETHMPVLVGIGMILILCGLFFKIAAVPFYMWAPDVYQGAPIPVAAFLSTTPKAATIFVLIKILISYLGLAATTWQPIILIVSCLSLGIGAIGALFQTNIKRLLAYSSIGHVGFILLGIGANDQVGIQASVFYLIIYLTMTLGAFAIISLVQEPNKENCDLSVFNGLVNTNPTLAFAMSVLLLSMAGIPPLAGFLTKFYIMSVILNQHLVVAVIAMLSAVISAFYYLKIIKIMYFNDVEVKLFDRSFSVENIVVAAFAVILNSILMFFPTIFESWIGNAVRFLLG